jgi:hypothetical protein
LGPAEKGEAVIVEALIGGVTVCFCASLRFAKWSVQRLDALDEAWAKREDARNAPPPPPPRRLTKEAVEEKKRVLERDRAEWAKGFGGSNAEQSANATRNVKLIDQQLLALADELRE